MEITSTPKQYKTEIIFNSSYGEMLGFPLNLTYLEHDKLVSFLIEASFSFLKCFHYRSNYSEVSHIVTIVCVFTIFSVASTLS